MTKRTMRFAAVLPVLTIAVIVGAGDAPAQQSAQQWQEECERRSSRPTVCEMRETRVAATGSFSVNARPNGGVRVEAWDRNEVLVRARVQASGRDMATARDVSRQIEVQVRPGSASASGPRSRNDQSWSVSYDVFVPRQTNLSLESVNGGLRVTGVSGEVQATTTNGGINLAGVTGRVRGSTTNGGINVTMSDRLTGNNSIDLRTTNGGIVLELPSGFAADLLATTTNGGIRTNLPVQVEGRRGRRVEAQLAGGGAPLRLRTTNGGINIRSR